VLIAPATGGVNVVPSQALAGAIATARFHVGFLSGDEVESTNGCAGVPETCGVAVRASQSGASGDAGSSSSAKAGISYAAIRVVGSVEGIAGSSKILTKIAAAQSAHPTPWQTCPKSILTPYGIGETAEP
jgi:hypothetical protein